METYNADLLAELLHDCKNNNVWPNQAEVTKMITGEMTPEKIDNLKTLRIQLTDHLFETVKWGLAKDTFDAEFLVVHYVNHIGFITNRLEPFGRPEQAHAIQNIDVEVDKELVSFLEENSDIIPAFKGEAAALRKLDIEKRLTDTESYIAAAANFVPPKMSKTAVEGVRVVLEMVKAGDVGPIAELIARAKGEVTAAKPAGLQPHAKPPGAPTPVPRAFKHVADLTIAEREARRERERLKKAKYRASLRP